MPSLVYTAPYSTTPQAGVETSPVASQGVIYIGASDGYLYAIDRTTGIIKDKYNLGAPIFSTVAVSGNRMISVTLQEMFIALYQNKLIPHYRNV